MDWRPIKAALTPAPEEDEVVENGWSVVWMDGWTDDILELKVNHQNMNKLFWGFVVVFLNPPPPNVTLVCVILFQSFLILIFMRHIPPAAHECCPR